MADRLIAVVTRGKRLIWLDYSFFSFSGNVGGE